MAQAALDTAALAGFSGELLRDGDQGYDDARTVFNASIDRRPALIARCAGVADVMDALAFAREQGLDVSVKGGGHSVSGHAVVHDGLVLDLRLMNSVRVDPERRTAWCGGGTKWGELDRETQRFGLAVTGGRLADTGVGGLTLGGGSGWIERKFGFTVDNLLSAEVVTADGRLVVASPDRNPDLFWALKGGGGNFGVVTGFEFQLHEVGPLLYGGMMFFPIERAADVLKAYRDFIEAAPDEVCGGSAILVAPPEDFVPEAVRGNPVLAVIACYLGPPEEGESAFAPIRDLEPALEALAPMPYEAVQGLIAPGNPPGRHHYWKAGFLGELSDEAVDTFVQRAADVVSPFNACLMLPLGGAFARVPDGDTPLTHRDAKWNYHVLSQWADPAEADRNIEWTRSFDQTMAEYARDGIYVNFVAEPTADAIEGAFGPEKYARVVEVKEMFDPDNLFRSNTNIRRGDSGALEVLDRGRVLTFTFADLMGYHGGGSPGGVAHAFKVLERALPLLEPHGRCERREIVVDTAFGGPGARDAFEMVTRAVTEGRFRVDAGLARPERGRALERFVFRLSYRGRATTLALREGFVTEEFIDLARAEERTPGEERRLDVLKLEMAERVMARPAAEVYDAGEPDARAV